jgi:hypothetical protein
VDGTLLIVLGDRHDAEDVLAALLPDRARGRSVGDERHLVTLVDVGHRLGDRARVGGEKHVDLVLGDQLLVQLDGRLGIGLVVEEHELDLPAEDATPGIHLVHPHLDRVDLATGGFREAPGLRDGAAEHDLGGGPHGVDARRQDHQDNHDQRQRATSAHVSLHGGSTDRGEVARNQART